jgi:uncharacterized protein (DUF1778 family)
MAASAGMGVRATALAPQPVRIDNVDTPEHHSAMTDTPTLPASADAKGSINLRIETRTRQLIDEAAAVLGKTRTEFMIETARREAIDVLLDRKLFALDDRQFDAFVQVLDNPPTPGPKLKALLRRKPAWKA